MPTDNEMRTLIALGAFSSVQGGGGDIPDDLRVNSLTATCGINSPSITTDNALVAEGIQIGGCSCNSIILSTTQDGKFLVNCEPVYIPGTGILENNTTLQNGRYYYINTDCSARQMDNIAVGSNATAEIWVETGEAAVTDFTLPSCWKWVGDTLPDTLEPCHFYDIVARNVKGVGTLVNVAFDTPVS